MRMIEGGPQQARNETSLRIKIRRNLDRSGKEVSAHCGEVSKSRDLLWRRDGPRALSEQTESKGFPRVEGLRPPSSDRRIGVAI